jgi:hypothetical protein
MPVQDTSLLAMANAIGIAEGFGKPGTIPTRANNPGDLKNGNIGYGMLNGITVYPTVEAGQMALQHQLTLIANGDSHKFTSDMTLTQIGQIYANGDPNWATNVAKNLNISPDSKFSDIISGTTTVTNPGRANPNGSGQAVTGNLMAYDVNRSAAEFSPLDDNDISTSTFDSLFPDVVIAEGLDETPWYDDPGLLIGNQPTRDLVQPVIFQVMLKGKGNFLLSDSTGTPIEVQLNASMKSFNLSSKHIFHEQRTRTAFHVTMWGMQADTIEGSCTTGVFMNQFGLTDFFSVADINDDLKTLVATAIQFADNSDGSVSEIFSQNTDAFNQVLSRIAPQNPQAAFRIAAQDAFVEFLSLFKMNGNVWFRTKNYQDSTPDREQAAPAAWSPQFGASSTQANARNNDVMTRGYVIMKFRSNTYLGYFKSLSWTVDARNPYQWNFSFVFQVERTLTTLYYPQ